MTREATIIEISQAPRDRVLAFRRELPGYIFILPVAAGIGFVCYVTVEILLAGIPDDTLLLYCMYCYAIMLLYSCLMTPFLKVYGSRCRLELLRQKIKARPDAIIDPYDPNAFVVYRISIGNRAVKPSERTMDIGLLLIDHEAGEIKFEGDMERWIIPREGIISARLDTYGSFLWNGTLMLWLHVPDEEKLLRPIKPFPIGWLSWNDFRCGYYAEILHRAIAHFVDPTRCPRPTDDELRPLIPPRR